VIVAKMATNLRPSGCMGLTKVESIFMGRPADLDQREIREKPSFA